MLGTEHNALEDVFQIGLVVHVGASYHPTINTQLERGMGEQSTEQMLERIKKAKSKSRKLVTGLALIAAIAAGVATFAANILSVRDTTVKLIWPPAPGPMELKVRDVRAKSIYVLREEVDVVVVVEAVVESQGTGEADCEAGLLVGGEEYGSSASVWGADRRTLRDGWWTFGRYVPSGNLRVKSNRQGVAEFHFSVFTRNLTRNGQFRLDCETLVTSWVPLEIPDIK